VGLRSRRAAKQAARAAADDDARDEFSDVRIIGPADRGGRDASADDASTGDASADDMAESFDEAASDDTGEMPDDLVLDELSKAFSPDRPGSAERPEPSRRGVTTISIAGDDLPDAVYLDEELDSAAGTVFIDDDGQGDAILPQEAGKAAIEPRLRQRRIGVRRQESRRRLKWVALGALVLAVVVAILAVLGSGLFAVDDVTVSGQQYADTDAVQEVVDDLLGTPTLLVDTANAERRLEEIAWVESARVRTDFPNSASIELRERVPLATMRGFDERYRILDREGRVLAIEDGEPVAPVLISGPGTLDLEVGQFADVGYAAAANLVTKLTPEVRSRLVSISATADGADIRLNLTNQLLNGEPAPNIEVRLGAAIADSAQFERLVRLERVLDDVNGQAITVIDVSTQQATQR
jgi:cell division protein FtsQ